MISWRSLKENAELTERFSILENGQLIQDLSGIHRFGKINGERGFSCRVASESENVAQKLEVDKKKLISQAC